MSTPSSRIRKVKNLHVNRTKGFARPRTANTLFFSSFFQADGTILSSVHNLSFQVADFFFLSFIVFQRIAKNLTLNIISGCCVYCRNFTTHIFYFI